MKKRTIILLIITALTMCMLAGCRSTRSNIPDDSAINMSNFRTIEGKDYLVYSIDTRVVYYMFSTSNDSGYSGYGYSYFAPYISENGNFCRYINDEIVEFIRIEDSNY